MARNRAMNRRVFMVAAGTAAAAGLAAGDLFPRGFERDARAALMGLGCPPVPGGMIYVGEAAIPPMDIRVGDVYFDTGGGQYWVCNGDGVSAPRGFFETPLRHGERVVYARTFVPLTSMVEIR